MTGDLPGDGRASPVFDGEFQEALARFQIRNGLRVSGFLDSRTSPRSMSRRRNG